MYQIRFRFLAVAATVGCGLCSFAGGVSAAPPLQVGFAEVDITPDISGDKKVWIAGYGQNRAAEGVHDPLMARAIVYSDGNKQIAMAAVDLVGLQYDAVKLIRDQLPELDYVMVASTHNHEGPDVLGLWGPSVFRSGIDPEYIQMVVKRTAEVIRLASKNMVPVTAKFGTKRDDSLVRDSREPYVRDGVLRAVRFQRMDNGKDHGMLVAWSSHPESMGSGNKQITADFPHATVAMLKKHYECPVIYFTSDCGGLMAPPRDGVVRDEEDNELHEGDFEYCRVYGEQVGQLSIEAIDSASPLKMTPLAFAAKPISVPMENKLYIMGKVAGLLKRDAFAWTGDHNERRDLAKGASVQQSAALETEVSYLRMGELSIAGIPGEIYPELVYGQIQEPADPGADFPDAPLEKSVVELVPDEKFLLIGLANDEIGYIIPLRQWDEFSPYAYGREKSQYGEENSVGKQAAPVLMMALEERVAEVTAAVPE